MGANRYTTQELIAQIRRVSHIQGVADITFTPTDLLAMCDTELETAILRQLMSVRENYYLAYEDFEASNDGFYPIPARAIGGKLADVQLINGESIIPITRAEISDQWSVNAPANGVWEFTIRGNFIQVKPLPNESVIRLYYYRVPNRLIQISEAGRVEEINGFDVQLSALPSGFTAEEPLDAIADQPQFDWLGIDIVPTGVAGTTVTLAEVPPRLAVGDWFALAGQTPVPQIPVQFRALLAQRIAVKIYEAQGYLPKMEAAQAKLKEMETDLFELVSPRVVEEPKKFVVSSDYVGGFGRWQLPPTR